MALAQGTDLLLLDEPTTYLDVAHQVEMLDLLADLNRGRGTTVVMVLHDLNLSARYADHLVAMRDGEIVAEGTPAEVVTEETVRAVFGLGNRVITDPVSHTPLVVPVGRHHSPRKGPDDDHDRQPLAADDPRRGRGGRRRAAVADVRPGRARQSRARRLRRRRAALRPADQAGLPQRRRAAAVVRGRRRVVVQHLAGHPGVRARAHAHLHRARGARDGRGHPAGRRLRAAPRRGRRPGRAPRGRRGRRWATGW